MKIYASFTIILVIVTVVESCWHLNPFRKDFSKKCDHWWNKATNYDGHRNRAIKRCVVLVQNKCPGTVTMTTGKVDKRVYKHYTLWKMQKKATYSKTQTTVSFMKKQKRGVCADDDGGPGNCNFWWESATWEKLETHLVDRCVSQVLKNCPELLTLVSDTTKTKNYKSEVVDIRELKYRHENGQEVTFRRYRFHSVGPKHSSG